MMSLSMDFDESDFKTYRLRHGDILLNEGQSTELVGRPAMWREELPNAAFRIRWFAFGPTQKQWNRTTPLEVFLYYLRTGQFAKISSKTSSVAHSGASRFAADDYPAAAIETSNDSMHRETTYPLLARKTSTRVREASQLFGSLTPAGISGRDMTDHERANA